MDTKWWQKNCHRLHDGMVVGSKSTNAIIAYHL